MAITYVTYNTGTADGSASTIATATTMAVTAGNFLVATVFSAYDSSNAVSSLTDGVANSFTFVDKQTVAGGDVELWYKAGAVANAAATFTATFAGNVTYRRITVAQFSGIRQLNLVSVDTLGTGTGTAATVTNTVTTIPDMLFVAGVYALGSVTHTAGSSFTKLSSGTIRESLFYRIVTAAGTYPNGTIDTLGSSQTYVAVMGAFKSSVYNSTDTVVFTPIPTSIAYYRKSSGGGLILNPGMSGGLG